MARMYFSFKVSKWNNKAFVPVDYIAFEKKKENGEVIHISVSCNGTSDFGVDSNNYFSCRFKGLEVCVEKFDKKGNEMQDAETHNYEKISRKDFELLKQSHPYEIGLDQEYNPDVKCPNRVQNLNVNITFYDANQNTSFETEKYKKKCNIITY